MAYAPRKVAPNEFISNDENRYTLDELYGAYGKLVRELDSLGVVWETSPYAEIGRIVTDYYNELPGKQK
jgi:hypothetical protein